jgi:peptide/nickel transport system ATP-binding protein
VSDIVLEVEDLTASAAGRRGPRGRRDRAAIVNGVDLTVRRRETVAVVGETGSGKTMTMLAATGLIPPGVEVSGTVRLLGEDLGRLPAKELRRFRGRHVGFVFQDPLAALDPLMPVGRQIGEAYRLIYGKSRDEARERALELLTQVGIPKPAERIDNYPHQFSGGMRQRVMIATALACRPDLLIADEATTALDVTTQAQVIALVKQLQQALDTAIVWITHDLGVVAAIADTVAVMYGGRIIEHAPVHALFDSPAHPYTRGLLAARPHLAGERGPLAAIPGSPPDPFTLPAGCAFHPRCPIKADPRCETEIPPLRDVGPAHLVRTFCPAERP